MERQITFSGKISPCKCGNQPKLIHSSAGDMYWMECAPCHIRLWEELTAGEAVGVWEFLANYHATNNLPETTE